MHRDQVPDRGGGVAWMGIKREPASAAIIYTIRPSGGFLSFFLSSVGCWCWCVCVSRIRPLWVAHLFSLSFFTGKNSIVRPSSFTFFLFYLSYYFSRFILFSIPPPHFSALAIVWVGFPVGTPWHTQDASIWDHLFSFFHLVRLHRSRRARRFYAHD